MNEPIREALLEAMEQAVNMDGLDVSRIGPQHWYWKARAALAAQPAQAQRDAYGGIADLRDAKWLDPECADRGACQSLRFKAQPAQGKSYDQDFRENEAYRIGIERGQAAARAAKGIK